MSENQHQQPFELVNKRGLEFMSFEGRRNKLYFKALSRLTILATGAFAKVMMAGPMRYKFKHPDMKAKLLDGIERAKREGRGVLTIQNHGSLLDDPFIWGILPWSWFLNGNIRWGFGADNVCFANK